MSCVKVRKKMNHVDNQNKECTTMSQQAIERKQLYSKRKVGLEQRVSDFP